MRWSWPDFLETPEPVIEDVARWMRELEVEERKRRLQEARQRERDRLKRGRR